jgi:uncharacterized membrane protein
VQPVLINEKEYSKLFRISLYIKGAGALSDVINGILIWFISKAIIVTFFLNFFQPILTDNPNDLVSGFIVDSAAAFAISSQYFIAIYLFSHGIIKLFLVINLFRRKLWAYPASIIIFSLLIVVESYELYYKYSVWLLAFTLLDILVVLLTVHEYGVLRRKNKKLINLIKTL